MARSTDTRQRVRELADKVFEEGGVPTPTLIRAILGTGSPNTITDELRQWRARRSGAASRKPDVFEGRNLFLEKAGLTELAQVLELAKTFAQGQKELLEQSAQNQISLEQLVADARTSLEKVPLLEKVIQEQKTWLEESLTSSEARADGTRKFLMRAMDESREETRYWKDRAKQLKDELSVWRMTHQQAMEGMRQELNKLKAQTQAKET